MTIAPDVVAPPKAVTQPLEVRAAPFAALTATLTTFAVFAFGENAALGIR